MSHQSVLDFGSRVFNPSLKDKRVLEVGSYDINGSLRPQVEAFKPEIYWGVDIEEGPRVDQVCNASDLVKVFGRNSYDLVISSEMLEHAEDWRVAINQMKQVARKLLLITTRGPGFPYHGFPHDHWRYTQADMRRIFADWDILTLEDDPEYPGVFMLARKTDRPVVNLKTIELTPAPPKPPWH